jgi:hypothetical protein
LGTGDDSRVDEQRRAFRDWSQSREAQDDAAAILRRHPVLDETPLSLCGVGLAKVLRQLESGPLDAFEQGGAVNADFVRFNFRLMMDRAALTLTARRRRAERRERHVSWDDTTQTSFVTVREVESEMLRRGGPSLEDAVVEWLQFNEFVRPQWQRCLDRLARVRATELRCPVHQHEGCRSYGVGPDVVLAAALQFVGWFVRPDLAPAPRAVPRLHQPKSGFDAHMWLLWQVVDPARIRLEAGGRPSTVMTTRKQRMPLPCLLHLLVATPDAPARDELAEVLRGELASSVRGCERRLARRDVERDREAWRVASLWLEDLP